MKKILSAILAFLMQLFGLATPEVSMQQVVDANNLNSLLQRYSNVCVTVQSDYIGSSVRYFSADTRYEDLTGALNAQELPYQYTLTTEDADYAVMNTEGQEGLLRQFWYVMSDEEAAAQRTVLTSDVNIVPLSYAGLKVDSIAKSAHNTLTMTATVRSDEPYALLGLPEGAVCHQAQYTFVIDRGNYALKSYTATLCLDDGTALPYYQVSVSYNDVLAPESMVAMSMQILQSELAPIEPMYTCTVIYNPGTDAEETFSLRTDAITALGLVLRDGYALYADAEGTDATIVNVPGQYDATYFALPIAE